MSIGDVVSIAGQLILSLSILVVLHECGHFFPAKWFKTKVEKFYLFFDPKFSLWKKKVGDTEYGLGWIPFGGYVKIAGMVDESMDMEQLKQPPQPWEFRSKPAWQRLIIMVGGVVVNFVLGFLLFAMIFSVWGKTYLKTEDAKYGIATDSIAQYMGLRDGDVITSIGSTPFERLSNGAMVKELALNNANTITVKRDGEEKILQVPGGIAALLTSTENKGKDIIAPRIPQKIKEVAKGGIAEKAQLKADDIILSINNNPNVKYVHEFKNELAKHQNENIQLSILRGQDTIQQSVKLDSTAKLGIGLYPPDELLTISREKFSFFNAIPEGVKEGVGFLNDQIKAFGQMFKGKLKVKDNLGSIFSVATLFDADWSWEKFWGITAMLSIILAFFNILPIPALDGGYVLFLLIEVITGKKMSDKFMEVVTTIGFILLMGLMIFALGLDISKLFR